MKSTTNPQAYARDRAENSKMKIINWNINGLKNKLQTVMRLLIDMDIDVVCITETHLKESDDLITPGYGVYRNDRKDCKRASGGVAILVKMGIGHRRTFHPECKSLEAVSVNLYLKSGRTLNIVSAYNRPKISLLESDFENVFAGSATLLLGDLNSKHNLWGCRMTNTNGKRLRDIAQKLGLEVDTPQDPTFYPSGSRSRPDILDIAVTKNFNVPMTHIPIEHIRVSDHVPVLISCERETNPL